MEKIKLDLNDLEVESFKAESETERQGTLHAQAGEQRKNVESPVGGSLQFTCAYTGYCWPSCQQSCENHFCVA